LSFSPVASLSNLEIDTKYSCDLPPRCRRKSLRHIRSTYFCAVPVSSTSTKSIVCYFSRCQRRRQALGRFFVPAVEIKGSVLPLCKLFVVYSLIVTLLKLLKTLLKVFKTPLFPVKLFIISS
jgi:hypothetical protein